MATPKPESLMFATEWLRDFAKNRVPTDVSIEFDADDLKKQGLTLLDVLHLFREGEVTAVDSLEGPGGVWVVEGYDTEDRMISAVILVFYASPIVRLHSIELNEEGPYNDAA